MRWEYETALEKTSLDLKVRLNLMGAAGWELVSVNFVAEKGLLAYLKRPIEEPDPPKQEPKIH